MIQLQVDFLNLPTWTVYVKLTWTDSAGQEYILYPYKPPTSPAVPQIDSHYLNKGYRFTGDVPETGYLDIEVITPSGAVLLRAKQPGYTTLYDTTGIGRTVLDWNFTNNLITDDRGASHYISQPVVIEGTLPPFPAIFSPGSTHTATATMLNPTAMSLDYDAELYLDVMKAASSGVISFSLAPGETRDIRFTVVMPSVVGAYPVYLDVFSSGQLIAAYQATEDVLIG